MRDFFSLSSDSVAAPTLSTGHAAGQLRQTLLQLLAIEIGIDALELGLDLIDAILDGRLLASAVNDKSGVFGDLDRLSMAEHVDAGIRHGHAEVLVDDLARP